jgi:hypothetical protein
MNILRIVILIQKLTVSLSPRCYFVPLGHAVISRCYSTYNLRILAKARAHVSRERLPTPTESAVCIRGFSDLSNPSRLKVRRSAAPRLAPVVCSPLAGTSSRLLRGASVLRLYDSI